MKQSHSIISSQAIHASSHGQAFLQAIKAWVESCLAGAPRRVFISYAWEPNKGKNQRLQRKLIALRDELEAAGFTVFLDIHDMEGKSDRTMLRHLETSDVVLPICTPYFCQRVQDKSTNVAFEYNLVVEKGQRNPTSVLPLILEGCQDEAVPAELRGSHPLFDLTDPKAYLYQLLCVSSHHLGLLPTLCQVQPNDQRSTFVRELNRFRLAELTRLPEPKQPILGREAQLQAIIGYLEQYPHLVIDGPEGIGKSALALAWAKRQIDATTKSYDFIHWISAAHESDLRDHFSSLAYLFGIDSKNRDNSELATAVYEALAALDNPRGLWIFDGVDHPNLEPFLPADNISHQRILVTARVPLWLEHHLTVPPLNLESSCDLLRRQYSEDGFDEGAANRLASLLQHSPSALIRAAGYLQEMQVDMAGYVDLLEEENFNLVVDSTSDHGQDKENLTTQEIRSLGRSRGGRILVDRLHTLVRQKWSSIVPRVLMIHVENSSPLTALQKSLRRQLATVEHDLTVVGFEVHLEVITEAERGPSDDLIDHLWSSQVVMPICTSDFSNQITSSASSLHPLYEAILAKGEDNPDTLISLHLHGNFATAVPEALRDYLVYSLADTSQYNRMLLGLQDPKGVLPALLRIDQSNDFYSQALSDWQLAQLTELPPYNPRFVGREALLEDLWQKLNQGPAFATSVSNPWVFHGTVGVGKSQAALMFAHRHFQAGDYTLVMWLQAENDHTLTHSVFTMAERLHIDTDQVDLVVVVAEIYRKLADRSWLLVFDNAPDLATLEPFLPPKLDPDKRQHILVTSRNDQWLRRLSVPLFTEQDVVNFVTQILPHMAEDDCQQLAVELGYLPLALNQAVACMVQTKLTVAGYLDCYRQQGVELFSQGFTPSEDEQTVMTTWQMSMNQLTAPLAREILLTCAFLSPNNITLPLLQCLPVAQGSPKSDILLAIKQLCSYSLLEASGLSQFKLHRLLQSAIKRQQWKNSEEAYVKRLLTITKALGNSIDYIYKTHSPTFEPFIHHGSYLIAEYDQLIIRCGEEHLERMWAAGSTLALEDAEPAMAVFALMMRSLANFIKDALGEVDKSLVLLQRASDLLILAYGAEHPSVAKTIHQMGDVYKSQGQYEKALIHYEESLRLSKQVYGSEHPDVAIMLCFLGNVCYLQGQYEKALIHYEESLTISRQIYGAEHPSVATNLGCLGNVYKSQGQYEKALSHYEESLRIERQVYGTEHPEVAETIHQLGNVFYRQGQYEKALSHYEESLRISRQIYGAEHPEVATAIHQLGDVYKSQGQYEKALSHYEESLRIYRQVYGTEHPEVATAICQLGNVYLSQGQYEEALGHYEESLRIYRQIYGAEHPSVAANLCFLGNLHSGQGQYEKALSHYEESLRIYRQVCGAERPEVATILGFLGNVYLSQCQYEKALSHYEESLRISRKIYGVEHLEVATILGCLGNVYSNQGRYEEALSHYEELLRVYRQFYGAAHPEVATTIQQLGNVYSSQGQYEKALSHYEESLKIFRQIYGAEHPEVATALRGIELVLQEQSDHANQGLREGVIQAATSSTGIFSSSQSCSEDIALGGGRSSPKL